MPKITLQPQGRVLEAPKREILIRFLQSHDIPVGSACGGMGLCASCKVTVLKGAKNLSPPNDTEFELKQRNNIQEHERISCQCKILGDIEITTSYW